MAGIPGTARNRAEAYIYALEQTDTEAYDLRLGTIIDEIPLVSATK